MVRAQLARVIYLTIDIIRTITLIIPITVPIIILTILALIILIPNERICFKAHAKAEQNSMHKLTIKTALNMRK